MSDQRYPVESAAAVAAAGTYLSANPPPGPQHTAVQRVWFTPRQLRKAARKGGITVTAEAAGDWLWLEWRYGVPEDGAP